MKLLIPFSLLLLLSCLANKISIDLIELLLVLWQLLELILRLLLPLSSQLQLPLKVLHLQIQFIVHLSLLLKLPHKLVFISLQYRDPFFEGFNQSRSIFSSEYKLLLLLRDHKIDLITYLQFFSCF